MGDGNGKEQVAVQVALSLFGREIIGYLQRFPGGTMLACAWEADGKPLGLAEIAEEFKLDLSLVENWDIAISRAAIAYNTDTHWLRLALKSENYGRLAFSRGKPAKYDWELVFTLRKKLFFSAIPLVGSYFTQDSGVELEALRVSNFKDDKQPENYVRMKARVFSTDLPLLIPLELAAKKRAPPHKERGLDNAPAENREASSEAPAVSWHDLNKNLGAITFYRMGFAMVESSATLYLDVGLTISGFKVILNGLSFGIPLSLKFKDTSVNLSGLEVALKTGLFSIGGGLVKMPGSDAAYGGKLSFGLGKFSLDAYALFLSNSSYTNIFIYLLMQYPLGGPPAFYMEGLAAAIGCNYALRLPNLNDVDNFPLVRMATGKNNPAISENSLGQVISSLGECLSREKDAGFGSFGVSFSSFGLAKSFILASASIGKEMEFSVLGVSELSVPPGVKDPIVYCKARLRCSYNTGVGIFSLEAALSQDSYILTKDCRLTGGLAVCFWTKGEHEGDFVICLGGYHDSYVKPAHYPAVDRLGLNWSISKNLALNASAYLALTPSCIMAGGRLALTYQDGALSAWLRLSLDIYVSWKPLYYDFRAIASIGVSLRVDFLFVHKTFSIELSANLHIYGPEFSGEITITIIFISFTIGFGNGSRSLPPKLQWDDFRKDFLPSPPLEAARGLTAGTFDALIKIDPSEGLIQKKDNGELVMDPARCKVAVSLSIPAKEILFGPDGPASTSAEDRATRYSGKLGIKPMGEEDIQSKLVLSVIRHDSGESRHDAFSFTVERRSLPAAMWGLGDDQRELVPSALTGISIQALAPVFGHASPPGKDACYTLYAQNTEEVELSENMAARARKLDRQGDIDPFAPVELRLASEFKSPLESGHYLLTASQAVKKQNGETIHNILQNRDIHIAADRFNLKASDIHSQYPPVGGQGDYSSALPGILLKHTSFPWQSSIGENVEGPSAVLLVFPENGGARIAWGTLADIKISAGIRCPEIIFDPVIGETPQLQCQLIDIPKELFISAMPRVADLPFTAHVRQAPCTEKAEEYAENNGLSCISAVRPPGEPPVGGVERYVACLVSIQGYGKLLKKLEAENWQSSSIPERSIRMVLYAHWTFSNIRKPFNFQNTFKNLNIGWLKPSAGPDPDAAPMLAAGYAQVTHHNLDGAAAQVWYRGPLAPLNHGKKPDETAPETLRGAHDRSLGAAYELGRLLALRDTSFAARVIDWRAKNVAARLFQFERSFVRDGMAASSRALLRGLDYDNEPEFTDAAYAFLAESVAAQLSGKPRARSSQAPARSLNRSGNIAEEFMQFCGAMAEAASGSPLSAYAMPQDKELADWLGRVDLLYGIPFSYMAPDKTMLPPESLRVFEIDETWLDSLKEGALGLGRTTPADELVDKANSEALLYEARCSARSMRNPAPGENLDSDGGSSIRNGLLLRSNMVAVWPAMAVRALDATGGGCRLLRMERLSEELLLCIFEGEISRIEIAEPGEQLHLDCGTPGNRTRKIRAIADARNTGATFELAFRDDGALDMAKTAKNIAPFLGEVTADVFSLQMLSSSAIGVVNIMR